jgi:hypothetical protein
MDKSRSIALPHNRRAVRSTPYHQKVLPRPRHPMGKAMTYTTQPQSAFLVKARLHNMQKAQLELEANGTLAVATSAKPITLQPSFRLSFTLWQITYSGSNSRDYNTSSILLAAR